MTEIDHESVVERIRQAADRLSDGARRVAELVLSHPEELALSPAAKVAEQLSVSESTVVRFATTIGFDGYPALRRSLQQQVRRHLDPAQRLEQYSGTRSSRVAVKSFQSDIDDLMATRRELDCSALDKAVKLISAAQGIYVIGLRSSFALAFTIYHHLSQMRDGVRLLDSGRGEIFEHLAKIGPKEVLVGVSFPRYTRLTAKVMKLAAHQKARVIAITDSPLSPITADADIVLRAHCSAKPFANSNVGALALVNALVGEVALKNQGQSIQSLSRLEKMLEKADVLFPDDPPVK